ncbi:GNAT family N-acetyltransferase [Pontibacter vulgaris]|uniref:GNAT family N-acetyltransferase n=1 Tax=Pontibacter vulgaris TaxID=2905679 RepID=UPI001FA772C8|nr:GNAT family protein [Pontibacter vulgaris]
MKKLTHTYQLPIAPDLVLREVTINDAPAIYTLIDSYRAYLREWLPFIDFSRSVKDNEAYLKSVTSEDNVTDQVFAIVYLERLVGIIAYKTIDLLNRKLEIGYWLGEPYQGKGIMRRCCSALMQHAFENMGINRIQIKVGEGNFKSSNIPKNLGFTIEGIEREGEFLNGRFLDLEIYSLLKTEWEAHRRQS